MELKLINSTTREPIKIGDSVEICEGVKTGEMAKIRSIDRYDTRIIVSVRVNRLSRVYAPYVLGLEEAT